MCGSSRSSGCIPDSQLVILSATIGTPQQFCVWAYQVRKVKIGFGPVARATRVPLMHEYREDYSGRYGQSALCGR